MNKRILMMAGLMLGLALQAEAQAMQELVCTSGAGYEKFTAKLDDMAFDLGSGLVRVKGARIIDNYASAELICAGHRPKEITCVGFWFNSPKNIAKVSVRKRDGRLESMHESLEGLNVPTHNAPWPCVIQQLDDET